MLVILAAAAIATVTAGLAAAEPVVPLRELVRKAVAGLHLEDERRDSFLFRARTERKELTTDGKVASQSSHAWERVEIDGFPFGRTLERDGKAVTEAERKSEDAAIAKRLAVLKAPLSSLASLGGETEADAAAAAALKRRGQQGQWFHEFPEALDFQLLGEETINGRPALHLNAEPKPGYRAKNMRARVFEKLKAQIWIDKASSELVKADAEMFDTVSVGFGMIGRVEKGTRFKINRRLVADGVWLIDSQSMRFDARILYFKTMHTEASTQWSDFRRRPTKTDAVKQK